MTALYNKDNTYYQLSGDSYDNKKINGKKSKNITILKNMTRKSLITLTLLM